LVVVVDVFEVVLDVEIDLLLVEWVVICDWCIIVLFLIYVLL